MVNGDLTVRIEFSSYLLTTEEGAHFRDACRGAGLDDSDTEDGRGPGDSDEEDGRGEHTSPSPESVHGPFLEECKTQTLTFSPFFSCPPFLNKKVRVQGENITL